MCGISGIVTNNRRDLLSDITQSLSDLEYRGYDSAGIGFIDGKSLKTIKVLGSPSKHLTKKTIPSQVHINNCGQSAAIGHTRWATNGAPTLKNAHPHSDCKRKLLIVHNGTISNADSLRSSLITRGHKFTSDTDTEVIAHAIEEASRHSDDFIDAFAYGLRMLEGSYAIALLKKETPNTLYIARNKSPLHFSPLKHGFVVASSPNALIRYTNKHYSLSDFELASLSTTDGVLHQEVFNFKNKLRSVSKRIKSIKGATPKGLSKGAYETFMLKEIHEQPETTNKTLLGRCGIHSGNAIIPSFEKYLRNFDTLKNICAIGCGTAYHAAEVFRHTVLELSSIPAQSEIASEYKLLSNNHSPKDTATIAISQSGETADTIEAVREVSRQNFPVFSIINTPDSTLEQESLEIELTHAGIEVGVASTKAFTAQLSLLYLLALKIARSRGMSKKQGLLYLHELNTIPSKMKAILKQSDQIRSIARAYKNYTNALFLGRGIHLPIAKEGALKFKEITYREAGAYPIGELKHGPLAIIDSNSVCVVLMPNDKYFDVNKNAITQIKSKGGSIIIITDKSASTDSILKHADHTIIIPTLKEAHLYPLLETLPLQLFAYHTAKLLKRDVDQPRNLAKSVTVE